MNDRNQYDELLAKYLIDELDTEEKVFVENWIQANEQNRNYFEEMKSVWNLTFLRNTFKKVNVEDEWNHFKQNITPQESKVIPFHQQEEETSYEDEPEQKRKSVFYRILISAAIAASVLLVIGFGWKFLINNKLETSVAKNSEKKADSAAFVLRHEVNTTGKEKNILLADGSLIVLADNSAITYKEPFTNSRDITLTGKAYFKVAHDKTKPFTVISNDILTTALGTEFTVTAFEKTNRIIVRLYEGKVVVKSIGKKVGKLKNDVYLLPGQEFIYTNGIITKPKSFKIEDENSPEKIIIQEMERDNPSIPESVQESWYMFNNQSLEEVLDELSVIYNVKIIYNKEEVNKIYFTRRYNRSDSLEFILQEIATLNDLKITKKDNAFIISK